MLPNLILLFIIIIILLAYLIDYINVSSSLSLGSRFNRVKYDVYNRFRPMD